MLLNANKRSVTLNLGTPRGREIFTDMLKKADVMIENFAPAPSSGWASATTSCADQSRIIYAQVKALGTVRTRTT
jgi:formyl-CoA transferase